MNSFILISDIHANARALEAVLTHSLASYPDVQIFCLGDIVGYGSAPQQALDQIEDSCSPDMIIGGNHDYGLVGMAGFDSAYFNPAARAALQKHRDILTKESIRFLEELPKFAQQEEVLLCHGSPRDTNHYITNELDITETLSHPRLMDKRVICFGHTHVPSISTVRGRSASMRYPFEPREARRASVRFSGEELIFVNPGSVGQPRDGVTGACYAIVDLNKEKVCWHRVDYDIAGERSAILAADLPQSLGDRLLRGH